VEAGLCIVRQKRHLILCMDGSFMETAMVCIRIAMLVGGQVTNRK
jgi:hypothetical protein